MSPDTRTPAGQKAGTHAPVPLPTTAQHHPVPVGGVVPALTLYQVPVPGAVEVRLPDGRTAWARPVTERLEPAPMPTPSEPMPAWAKAACAVTGSLTLLALGSATALRIAAPALGVLVDVLDMIWRVALVLAVLLFGALLFARRLFHTADSDPTGPTADPAAQPFVFAPHIDTGGTRLIGRAGDVNVQFGDRNRNKQ